MKWKVLLLVASLCLFCRGFAFSQCDTNFYMDVNSLKQGKWAGITEGGYSMGCYKNGLRDGHWQTFYPDSTLWYKETFLMGLTLSYTKYSREGSVQEQVSTSRTDSGLIRFDTLYYANGGIWRLSEFKYVENVDSLKSIDESGIAFHHFENWVYHGLHLEYFEDSSLKSSIKYKEGVLHGQSIHFLDPNNATNANTTNYRTVGQFNNGRPHGEWKLYFSSGELSTIYIYDRGKRKKKKVLNRKE